MKSPRISLVALCTIGLCCSLLILQSCGSEGSPEVSNSEQQEAVVNDLPACSSEVVVTTDSLGTIVSTVLVCAGGCGQDPCVAQSISDDEGNQRRWCGCSDVEGSDCHIILFQPKLGNARYFCNQGCAMDYTTSNVGGSEVIRYSCSVVE